MDNSNTPIEMSDNNIFSNTQNIIIIILCILLMISVLGVQYIEFILNIVKNSISQLFLFFGYTTGTLINVSSDIAGTAAKTSIDIVGTAAKTGIDIADGTVHDIGNILKNENRLDNVINSGNAYISSRSTELPTSTLLHKDDPIPDNSENSIQKPITANKNNWCLVGEYQQKRGCIEIKDTDKCLSGQVFSSQQLCIQSPGIFQSL